MSGHAPSVLVYGYGNPGRLDDGLGPAFVEALAKMRLSGVVVDSNYQLSVEDAAEVAKHEVVIFVDASVSGPDPFFFNRLEPKAALSFSSHSLEAPAVLALAEELFSSRASAYALGIRGYSFNEFGERLSPRAEANLARALQFMESVLRDHSFRPAEERHHWSEEEALASSVEES